MKCPECNRHLKNPKQCTCGWSGGGEAGSVSRAVCYGCHRDLPWPSMKAEKPPHRIIGLTSGRQPLCNRCYESSHEFDWRDKEFTAFHEKHKNDNWGVLIKMAYAMKGAPKEDVKEFVGYLKDEVKKGGGMFGKLPYDPAKREPA